MADHGGALAVRFLLSFLLRVCACLSIRYLPSAEEFALLEASYAIIRILQTFQHFECDPAREISEVGQELQDVTLVLASGEGCWLRASKQSPNDTV